MSEKDKIAELNTKIEGLSKQLEEIQKSVNDIFTRADLEEASQGHKKRSEQRQQGLFYYEGLFFGVFLGIVGNLFVQSLTEYLKSFDLAWGILFVVTFGITTYFISIFLGRIRRILESY